MFPWILALSYWLHMVATIVWVGGLALMALVIWPGAQAVIGPGPQLAELMRHWQQRFSPLAWISLAVLVVTGLIQMTANKSYTGLLHLNNPWSAAILVKHIAVGGMVVIGGYMQWALQPTLGRLAALEARGHGERAPELERLRRQELTLTRLNLLCGVLVLAFTAMARVL